MDFLMEWRWMLAPLLACFILSITHVYWESTSSPEKSSSSILRWPKLRRWAPHTRRLSATTPTIPATIWLLPCSLSPFTFAGAGLFSIARMRKERVPQEAFIGIVYAAASAAAVLILSKSPTGGEELKHMLVGDILLVSIPTIINDAILYSLVADFSHVAFRRRFLAISVNDGSAHRPPELTFVSGIFSST